MLLSELVRWRKGLVVQVMVGMSVQQEFISNNPLTAYIIPKRRAHCPSWMDSMVLLESP